jgi:hypothetical protein
VTSDDPFGGGPQPPPPAQLSPAQVALAGKVFGVILGDIAAGKPAAQIVADVHAVLATAPARRPGGAAAARRRGKSHRLVPPGKG